ncbi:hypothetical protein GWK47_038595 [Chionoecetes opilio]|uniref:Uncharacterized protein n=1 Tax=Chionoecetes opilio TaxID=41210 RepID=A0A8J4YLR1_CHIOP|nr:hypothetical protein GWK47_038595 [Chionoecetes opilio]
MGGLRTGTKSDLMPCLENLVPVKEDLSTPRVQVNILDGAPSSTCCDRGTEKTFQGYALMSSCRMSHPSFSMRTLAAREKGELGEESSHKGAVPGNWQEFLRINDNKTELFSFLASNVADIDTNKHSPHHPKALAFFAPIAGTCQL